MMEGIYMKAMFILLKMGKCIEEESTTGKMVNLLKVG